MLQNISLGKFGEWSTEHIGIALICALEFKHNELLYEEYQEIKINIAHLQLKLLLEGFMMMVST